jgi:hypothetical protein
MNPDQIRKSEFMDPDLDPGGNLITDPPGPDPDPKH